jgi:integrase/recombinase XerD
VRTSCADYACALLKMENHLKLNGNSLGTQKPYLRAVRDLMESCKSVPELLNVDQIKSHLVSFVGKGSSSALNLRVCGIKYYFRYVVKRPDLVVDIPNPRVAKYVQAVLSEAEVQVLREACMSMRELALIDLLFDTGLRSREVAGLQLGHFDRINHQLTVFNGKGQKMRTLPYSLDLRKSMAAYFKTLPEHPAVYLFENKENPGSAITIRGVQYIVKEVLKRSKLKKEVHPHTFRHSYAVHYINNGGNILRLQQLLGHEHIETTLHYLKFCSIPLFDCPTPLAAMLARQSAAKLAGEAAAQAKKKAFEAAELAAKSKGTPPNSPKS